MYTNKIIYFPIFCLLFFTASIVFGQTNPTVVVTTFSARGQAITADDAESITELFIAELAKTGGLRVVDRTSLDRVVAEMRFQTSDWSNPQKTARLGSALNADFLIRGQINQLGQQITVAITALDIKTLEIVSSSTETFNINDIYDTRKDSTYYKVSIFGIMPSIAKSVNQSVVARLSPSLLVGRWRSNDNRAIIEFRADSSIIVERYEFSWTLSAQTTTIGKGIANGTGNYVFGSMNNGSPIIIKFSLKSSNDVDVFSNIEYSGSLKWETENNFTLGYGTIKFEKLIREINGEGLPHNSYNYNFSDFSKSFTKIKN